MWKEIEFKNLTTEELFAIYYLRTATFVVDQQRIYQEVDLHDVNAWHVFKMVDKKIIAYARIFLKKDYITFGRVVTAKEYRGQGLGKELMTHIMQAIRENFPQKEIEIEAQQQVEEFYKKFDFISQGDSFIFESTPHIKMVHQPLLKN